MIDLSKQNFKEELYLTATITTTTQKDEEEKRKKEEEYQNILLKNNKIKEKIKLKLPQIIHHQYNNSSTINYTERYNINSYFSPENYHHYSESCNKYYAKLDPVIKDKLSPRNLIMKARKYDIKENKILSDLKKDEMIHRSAGMGMFIRIQQYNSKRKKKPFRLIIRNLNDNNKFIKKSRNRIIKDNNITKYNKTEIDKNEKVNKLLNFNNLNEEDDENIRPMNELLRKLKPPNFKIKMIDHSQDLIKMGQLENKIRDQKIVSALIKSGDENLKYNIGVKIV